MSYTITVKYVNEPMKSGGARGTVKDADGNSWGVPAEQLPFFVEGGQYLIETEERSTKDGHRYTNILRATDTASGQSADFDWSRRSRPTSAQAPAIPSAPPPAATPSRERPADAGSRGVQITVVALLKSGLESGQQQYSEEAILENLPWLARVARAIEKL